METSETPMEMDETAGGASSPESTSRLAQRFKSSDSNETPDEGQQLLTPLAKGNSNQPSSLPRKKITEYIVDKQLRIRSYYRRRPIPFKRAHELDTQCGTRSILIQFSEDVDECLYYGSRDLVERFLSDDGLKISDVQYLVYRGRSLPDEGNFTIDHDESEEMQVENGDRDYSPMSEDKKKLEKKKKEQLRKQSIDPSKIPVEKGKVLGGRKESLISKIRETDSICGSRSFLVIISGEKEAAFYYGDKDLVSRFFTTGLSRTMLPDTMNIRAFEPDETEYNVCSVPHCVVSRNTLSKWRLAAIDLFRFPDDIPMTLHLCPETERERWIAEIDLDPKTSGKISVCSLHFRDGYPTKEHPFPMDLLSEKEVGSVKFRGKKKQSAEAPGGEPTVGEPSDKSRISAKSKTIYSRLIPVGKVIKKTCLKRNTVVKRKHYKQIVNAYTKKSFGRVACRFCNTKFLTTHQYFGHVREHHLGLKEKDEKPDEESPQTEVNPEAEPEKKEHEEVCQEIIEEKDSPAFTETVVSDIERRRCLAKLYPNSKAVTMNPRKKYVCAVCKSVCDLFGLFVHMKQVHKGLLCQYCLKLFKKVGDLETHLRNVHRVVKRYYHSTKEFTDYSGSAYSLICSGCNHLIRAKDLDGHQCTKIAARREYGCPFCDRAFQQQSALEMHICNGWCKYMPTNRNPSQEEVGKLFKVLTGLELRSMLDHEKSKKPAAPTPASRSGFSVNDRNILSKYPLRSTSAKSVGAPFVLEDVPTCGNIYCGLKARGISNHLKKEIKDTGHSWSLMDEIRNSIPSEDAMREKADTVKEEIKSLSITRAGKNFFINNRDSAATVVAAAAPATMSAAEAHPTRISKRISLRFSKHSTDDKENFETSNNAGAAVEQPLADAPKTPMLPQVKESKAERIARVAEEIVANLNRMKKVVDRFEETCMLCYQAKTVSVNAKFLLSHLVIIHDKNEIESIMGENPQFCISRIKKYLKDIKGKEILFTYDYDVNPFYVDFYHCCVCRDARCSSNDQLTAHLETEHNAKVMTCTLCRNVFLNYGSLISHICGGPPTGQKQPRARFGCKICKRQNISTFLELQKHIRSDHNTCEICFVGQGSQGSLYSHCKQHNQDLMCMKCFMTYENANQLRKHLYLTHESEHKVCKVCHQKTWPHVYHFCLQDLPTTCEVCDVEFASVRQYHVHMRMHTGKNPYACSAKGCKKGFISKQLLWKHHIRKHPELKNLAEELLNNRRAKKELEKFGASSLEVLDMVKSIVDEILHGTISHFISEDEDEGSQLDEASDIPSGEDEKEEEEEQSNTRVDEAPQESEKADTSAQSSQEEPEPKPAAEPEPEPLPEPEPEPEELDPIAAAIASIMGPDGEINIKKSPVKPPTPRAQFGSAAVYPPAPAVFQPRPTNTFQIHRPSSAIISLAPTPHATNPLNLPASSLPKTSRSIQLFSPPHSASPPPITVRPPPGPALIEPPTAIRKFISTGNEISVKAPPVENKVEEDVDTSATEDAFTDVEDGREVTGSKSPSTKSPASKSPTPQVMGGIWNQDLMFVGRTAKVRKPRLDGGPKVGGLKVLRPSAAKTFTSLDQTTMTQKLGTGGWDLLLSEDSDEEDAEGKPKKVIMKERILDTQTPLVDHDYCYASWLMSQPPSEDLSEMDKILSNVAMGAGEFTSPGDREGKRKHKKKKKDKKKRKKQKRKHSAVSATSGSDSETEVNVTVPTAAATTPKPRPKHLKGPKPKYHTPGGTGVTAAAARPVFDSSSDEGEEAETPPPAQPSPPPRPAEVNGREESDTSDEEEIRESDLDTDFSADEAAPKKKAVHAATPKAKKQEAKPVKSLKLKIKLPPKPEKKEVSTQNPAPNVVNTKLTMKIPKQSATKTKKSRKRKASQDSDLLNSIQSKPLSKKMRESLALNIPASSSSSEMESSDEEDNSRLSIDMAGGSRVYNETEKLYCVCECPHDDVSEMIGCDAPDCRREWFHFECVGIMVPPEGTWYCPECTKRYKINL